MGVATRRPRRGEEPSTLDWNVRRLGLGLLLAGFWVGACAAPPPPPPPLQRMLPDGEEEDLAPLIRAEVAAWALEEGDVREAWEFDAEPHVGCRPLGGTSTLRADGGLLRIATTGGRVAISCGARFEAREGDHLWLRLRSSRGGPARLYWATATQPTFDEQRSLAFVVPPDEEADHVLATGTMQGWRDEEVLRLRLDLPRAPDPTTLDFVRLLTAPREAAPSLERLAGKAGKVTIGKDTRLALVSGLPGSMSWEVTAGAGARLRFSYGTLDRVSTEAEGVRFSVDVEADDGERRPAFSAVLDPAADAGAALWRESEVDLSAYRGNVTLHFQSEPSGAPGSASAAGLAAWGNPRVLSAVGDDRPNVVLIALDTLRADTVGAYGHPRDVTPNLDRLAARGAVFESAVTQAPWSLPSYASLFTSLYPSTVGVFAAEQVLPADATTLAALLRRQGYRTVAFTGGGYAGRGWGFDNGFERFEEVHDIEELTGRLDAWLEAEAGETPFFLYLHTYELHDYFQSRPEHLAEAEALVGRPLDVPENVFRTLILEAGASLDDRGFEDVRMLYEGAVRYTDRWLGRWLDRLEARQRVENSVVVVLSDHGESFGERGRVHHGSSLELEQVHVPLVIVPPSRLEAASGPRRVPTPVELVDVLPTILELVGTVAPEGIQGRSLSSHLMGRPDDDGRPVFSELTERSLFGAYSPGRRYLYGGQPHVCGPEGRVAGRAYCEVFAEADFGTRSRPPARVLPTDIARARLAFLERYLDATPGLHLVAYGRDGISAGSVELQSVGALPPEKSGGLYAETDDRVTASAAALRLSSGDLDVASWSYQRDDLAEARFAFTADPGIELRLGSGCGLWRTRAGRQADDSSLDPSRLLSGHERSRLPADLERSWACLVFHPRRSPSPETAAPSPEALERLRALGYVQ